MHKLVITTSMILASLVVGCAPIGEPPLRIAISKTAGSAVFYSAQEHGLFTHYGVEVELVELNSRGESWESFEDGDTDAALMTFEGFVHGSNPVNEAGILVLIASRCDTIPASGIRDCHNHAEAEILVGSRSAMMARRDDWQRVLMAFEHSRLIVSADTLGCAVVNISREHCDTTAFLQKMRTWKLHGVMAQDSLLRRSGPFGEMEAYWHGRAFMSQSTTSQIDYGRGQQSRYPGDYVR